MAQRQTPSSQRQQSRKSYDRVRDASMLSIDALDRWKPQMRAARPRADAGTVLDIYDIIGVDWWSCGVTAAWVADQIRGAGDITININSPGGDFFEGLAIYNLLRAHAGKKTVNIIGMAASAASLLAAAGDDILIGAAAYVMIHNCWGGVIGDKNDMTAAAATFGQFDAGALVIYKTQTGASTPQITDWMDAETWFLGQSAIDSGFATGLLPADVVIEEGAAPPSTEQGDPTSNSAMTQIMALRRAEMVLCQSMPRAEARRILNQIKSGKPDAAALQGKQDAAVYAAAADSLRGFLQNL